MLNEYLSLLPVIVLSAGSHKPGKEMCVMEAASYIAGEPWTDHPDCVQSMVADMCRSLNDHCSDDFRNEHMTPLVFETVGTAMDLPPNGKREMRIKDDGSYEDAIGDLLSLESDFDDWKARMQQVWVRTPVATEGKSKFVLMAPADRDELERVSHKMLEIIKEAIGVCKDYRKAVGMDPISKPVREPSTLPCIAQERPTAPSGCIVAS